MTIASCIETIPLFSSAFNFVMAQLVPQELAFSSDFVISSDLSPISHMRRLAVQSFSLQKIKRPSLKDYAINSKKDRIACLGQSVIRRKLLISQFLISYTAFIITYQLPRFSCRTLALCEGYPGRVFCNVFSLYYNHFRDRERS